MMLRIPSLFALFLITLGSFAQRGLAPGEKDSLWTVWNNEAEPDSVRLKAIQRIAWHGYLFSQPDSAYFYATLHYHFAEERGLRKPMSSALNIQATALNFQGDWENALQLYQRSLEIGEELGDLQGVGVCLNNMGNIFKNQGHYKKAVDSFFKSLKIREEVGDTLGMASTYGNIASLFKEQGDYDQSLDYFERCLVIMERIGNIRGVAGTLNNMGLVYSDLGDLDRAVEMYAGALELHEQTGDMRGMSGSLSNIGNLHFRRANYEDAAQAHQQSLELREATGDKKGVAQSLHNLGMIEAAQHRHGSAIELGNRAYSIAKQVGDVKTISDVASLLHLSYKAIDKYDRALEMYEVHVSMRDSLVREANQRELMRRQFQYEYDKREADLVVEQERKDAETRETLLRQRAQRNMLGVGFLALLFIGGGIGYFFYNRKKAEYKYRSILLELKAVKAQVSPHFFFNAMNSVVNMITSNRSEEAEHFLTKYARLMRQTLRDSDRELTTLKEEIDVLTNYLELEVIRLAGRFTFTFQIDDRLDPEAVLIPSMLIQPLVENAVWHGVAPIESGGEIYISFKPDGDLLHVSVEDNGVGRTQPKEPNAGPAGISITAQRIALYNQRYRTKGELTYEDLPRGLRCTVRIALITE